MRNLVLFTGVFIGLAFSLRSQNYFPPTTGDVWDTMSPAALGWCPDKIQELYDYLDARNSKGFIILKDGKIVLEKYFDTFTKDSFYVWNSAGKTLVAMAVGIAQEENLLQITDTTSDYLGTGWTSLPPTQEEKITIRHQLTMTTGLDDNPLTLDCTTPACLNYLADPGLRWSYHNAPYTLLSSVVENASGVSMNSFITSRIKAPTGMDGFFMTFGYNKVFISRPRSMARYGLLLLADGVWDGTTVLGDLNYLNDMRNSSQTINNSYGYLTWLNGKSSYMLPQAQFVFNGNLMPNAPADLYSAAGKNGQLINVVPSENMVLVRVGEGDEVSLAPNYFNDTIWQKINELSCTNGLPETKLSDISLFPNPAQSVLNVKNLLPGDKLFMRSSIGSEIVFKHSNGKIETNELKAGVYFLIIERENSSRTLRFVVN